MTPKVRVVTQNGYFDIDTPDGFVFGVFIASIRSAGYFMNDNIYQPVDRIITVYLFDPDAPGSEPVKPRGEGTILQ